MRFLIAIGLLALVVLLVACQTTPPPVVQDEIPAKCKGPFPKDPDDPFRMGQLEYECYRLKMTLEDAKKAQKK